MGPFEMVVAIVLIATIGSIYKSRYDAGGKKGRKLAEIASADNAQLRSEIAQLKERIATLERIAVDRSNRLSAEIESLRDR